MITCWVLIFNWFFLYNYVDAGLKSKKAGAFMLTLN